MARLLGGDKNESEAVMEGIYEFERRMAEIYVSDEIQRDPKLSYNTVSIS